VNEIPTAPSHSESAHSGSSSLARRRFILLSAVAGLAAIVSPYVVPRLLRRFDLTPDLYRGPLLDKINELVGRLDRRVITPEQFVSEVHRRYNEIDLQAEFNEWLGEAPDKRVNRELYRQSDRLKGRKRTLTLFYIPSRQSHPPHAHHNAASVQCVLKGNAHVRQYERVARRDPRTLKLLPCSDMLLRPYESILMTEYQRNVHWFGADDHPVIVLNYSINGGFSDTFDGAAQRPMGRYYVDPTVGEREGQLILAPEIGVDESYNKFSLHAVSEFSL